jgi:Peptidase family M28
MQSKSKQLFQPVVVFIVLAASIIVAVDQTLPPGALPASAAATQFSAERAIEQIRVIAQAPRLVGESGFEAARDYVMARLGDLGMKTEIQKTRITLPDPLLKYFGWNIEPTQNVENILARIEGSESRYAVLLVAHLDSIGGPGASDDASGVAVLLETARALLAGSPLKNTVIFLFTAPEETGLHGSAAFILEHPWIKDVKLVINFDSGGLSGPSELTNTSPQNGWLIQNLAKADPYVLASSDAGVGDSDFNTFKFYGFSGYAFDYARDRRKHTPFDNIQNLNPASIQHQGYHALYLARYYGNLASLEDPKEPNPVFFNILRLGLIQYPRVWGIVLMVVCMLLFVGVMVLGFRRKCLTLRGLGLGTLVFVVSLATAPLIVRILWAVLSKTVPAYGVRFYGHAVNEPLLLALFASVAIAITSAWYALLQVVRKVHWPDLSMGALSVLSVYVAVSITSPESSFRLTWCVLVSLLASGFWFASVKRDVDELPVLPMLGLLLAGMITIALQVPGIYMSFTGSDTDNLFMSMVALVAAFGLLVTPLHIIIRPYKWLLAVTAGLSAIVLLGVAILV